MTPLTQFKKISRRVFDFAGRIPIQVLIRVKRGVLVRYTNNGVHQNGFQDLFSYTIRLLSKEGPVYVESNDPTEEGIRVTMRRALVKLLPPLRGKVGMGGKTRICPPPLSSPTRGEEMRAHREHFPFPIERAPEMAADAIEEGLKLIRPEQAVANGYYSAYERFFYLSDSNGLELFHPATAARFGVTITKGAGKGFASAYHPNPKKVKVQPVVAEAFQMAREAARGDIKLPPGEYECVFSPHAFLDFIEPLRRHFDAQFCRDKKSVFSGLLGKQLFSKALTVLDDVRHPGQFGVPFDDEGAPKRKVTLIKNGRLKELLSDGFSTRAHWDHPFYPQNLVVEPGAELFVQMLKRMKRGIFINQVWYPTLVREREMDVTGFSTRGSLYIENGEIRGQAAHLRYHDSIFSVLKNVAAVSREQLLLKDRERGAALFPYIWISKIRVV